MSDASEPEPSSGPLLGAVEGGGTKTTCAIGRSAGRWLERTTLPTRDPGSTLHAAAEFFAEAQRRHGALAALGVAFFGPLELRPDRPAYGRLLETPKPGWSGADVLGELGRAIRAPVGLDTDVAAAALAERRLGAARDVESVAYVTVGTGIGVGFAPDPLKAVRLFHPEAGHLTVRRVPGDEFAGVCPFHGDCLEGLASGPAIRARWGAELRALPAGHPATAVIGAYLGQLAVCIALLVPVERVIFGGGVMAGGALLPFIRAAARDGLRGYVGPLSDSAALDRYISGPGLGEHAGLAGAFLLAADAWARSASGPESAERAGAE